MYRSLGTRGSVFGVPSGPYAGKERVVSFARLPDASKRRLVDALSGKGALSPILRPGPPRRSLRVLFGALLVVGLYGLFAARWPSRQTFVFAAYDVVLAGLLAWTVRGARRTLSFEGTTILAGTYLFPLDVVEASSSGVLRIVPLGKVREAAISIVASRPSLLLTFDDGTSRAFGVNSPKEAEAAYGAMETAQKTLEKLTYDRDLAAAVNLDPFFEVRMDGSWESVEPGSQASDRRSAAITLGAGLLVGLALFGVRYMFGVHADMREKERTYERQVAELQRAAEESKPRPTLDVAHAPDAELLPDERTARIAQRERALRAFRERARSPEVAALMDSLLSTVAQRGGGLKVYVAHVCRAASCAAHPGFETELRNYEERLVRIFQSVFSETVPRQVLAFDLTRLRPGPEEASLSIDYVVTAQADGAADAGTQELTMRFEVDLRVPGHPQPPPFTLTMPPPKAPLTALRDHSIFGRPERGGPESFVFARGFDRLYDELYGMFFAGAPRVPLHRSTEDPLEGQDTAVP